MSERNVKRRAGRMDVEKVRAEVQTVGAVPASKAWKETRLMRLKAVVIVAMVACGALAKVSAPADAPADVRVASAHLTRRYESTRLRVRPENEGLAVLVAELDGLSPAEVNQ